MAGKTTEKGLGWHHQQAIQRLKDRHVDGSPCPECGRPRWLDPTKNFDYVPGGKKRGNGVLQGDHSKMPRSKAIRLGLPVLPPDRLLHAECNRIRGARDDSEIMSSSEEVLTMPWPWL